jgi:hypothetical protein
MLLIKNSNFCCLGSPSFLGSTAHLRPWPPQNPAEFLGGFSTIFFFFYRVGLLAPRPTPIPEDQASVLFISPRGRVVTHFSRLLRHAWVTVGLFLFPGHHTGSLGSRLILFYFILYLLKKFQSMSELHRTNRVYARA